MIELQVEERALSELNRALRQRADRKEMQKRIRKELRTEARELIPPLRAAVMATPSKGLPHKDRRSLRELVARSANVQVKIGSQARVRVFMDPRKMPDGMKALPQYLEGGKGHEHWRHPIFGTWKEGQPDQPSHPYFRSGVRDAEQRAADGVRRVIDQIAREIESG